MTATAFPPQFKRETHTINGVNTIVLTAGSGPPLVFLHGAGIWHGVNFALPWTQKFRVIVPFHPGLGEADDDPAMTNIHDYVMHYLDLFDALGLSKFNLVGFSLGGWLAANFAVQDCAARSAPRAIFFFFHPRKFLPCWCRTLM
jgi:pimeloyl-ACP methyl ester carboxylesterase